MILGAHVSAAGGVQKTPGRAHEIGARGLQLFTKNQRRWLAQSLTSENIKRFRENRANYEIKSVLAHDSYLINLAAQDDSVLKKSKTSFIDELERASLLGVDIIVMHPGAHVGAGIAAGIETLVTNLDACLDQLEGRKIIVALETTAGQGSQIGSNFEELRDIREQSRHSEMLGVCIDTCHIHAAGYDLTTSERYEETISIVEAIIGVEHVVAWHLNDSVTPLGSNRDRHAKLGEGTIGVEAFLRITADQRWENVPGILETPGGPENWKRELDLLEPDR